MKLNKDGKSTFVQRSPEELQNLEDIVKNLLDMIWPAGIRLLYPVCSSIMNFCEKEQLEMQNQGEVGTLDDDCKICTLGLLSQYCL